MKTEKVTAEERVAHTPGKWFLLNERSRAIYAERSGEREHLATVESLRCVEPTDESAEQACDEEAANAAFIVTACNAHEALVQQVADLTEERNTHECSYAVEKFLERDFEVVAHPDFEYPTEWPDAMQEQPLVRIAWADDRGDPSVGIDGWSGFVLAPNQEGTFVAELLKKSAAHEALVDALRAAEEVAAMLVIDEIHAKFRNHEWATTCSGCADLPKNMLALLKALESGRAALSLATQKGGA